MVNEYCDVLSPYGIGGWDGEREGSGVCSLVLLRSRVMRSLHDVRHCTLHVDVDEKRFARLCDLRDGTFKVEGLHNSISVHEKHLPQQ